MPWRWAECSFERRGGELLDELLEEGEEEDSYEAFEQMRRGAGDQISQQDYAQLQKEVGQEMAQLEAQVDQEFEQLRRTAG